LGGNQAITAKTIAPANRGDQVQGKRLSQPGPLLLVGSAKLRHQIVQGTRASALIASSVDGA
jgi:hypothetical protein